MEQLLILLKWIQTALVKFTLSSIIILVLSGILALIINRWLSMEFVNLPEMLEELSISKMEYRLVLYLLCIFIFALIKAVEIFFSTFILTYIKPKT